MTIAEELAKYVNSFGYHDMPREAVHSAELRIIDTLGCAIGASKESPVRMATKALESVRSDYQATLLGTKKRVDAQIAAFINGGAARYFDFNDDYDAKEFSHPSDNIMPLLAVAEAEKANGKEALLAIIQAYEIQCRLCDAASLWKKGWDQVTYMLVSIAAAASRLMGLSVEQTTQAINIALNSHIVMRQLRAGELSMWKAFAPSNAARNAIFAARLAKQGVTGPAPVFEGEMGFFKQVTGRFALDTRSFGGRSKKYRINETQIKQFPAEVRAQAAIEATIELRKRLRNPDQVKRILVETNEAGYKILGKDPEKWHPKTKETADHSLPFVVAVALIDGKLDIASFKESRLRDRKTLDFMKRIKVREKPEFTAMFGRGGTVNADELTLRLRNGDKLNKRVVYPRGHPRNPMSDRDIETKFQTLAGSYLGRAKAKSLLQGVWKLDKLDDIGDLFQMMITR